MDTFLNDWEAEQRRIHSIISLRYRVVAKDGRAGEPALLRNLRVLVGA